MLFSFYVSLRQAKEVNLGEGMARQEFEVRLTDPQDCHIRGGASCRVKIIDQVG